MFTLTTDKGTYKTIKLDELLKIEAVLQLSQSLIYHLHLENLENFSENTLSHIVALESIFVNEFQKPPVTSEDKMDIPLVNKDLEEDEKVLDTDEG